MTQLAPLANYWSLTFVIFKLIKSSSALLLFVSVIKQSEFPFVPGSSVILAAGMELATCVFLKPTLDTYLHIMHTGE